MLRFLWFFGLNILFIGFAAAQPIDLDTADTTKTATVKTPKILFDFNQPTLDSATAWTVFTDQTMGGASQAEVNILPLNVPNGGMADFVGELSLDNGGGIAAIISPMLTDTLQQYKGLTIKLKGDGRSYILSLQPDIISAVPQHLEYKFKTVANEWQEVKIPFSAMYMSFFDTLIANKKINLSHVHYLSIINAYQEGSFDLKIDEVSLF